MLLSKCSLNGAIYRRSRAWVKIRSGMELFSARQGSPSRYCQLVKHPGKHTHPGASSLSLWYGVLTLLSILDTGQGKQWVSKAFALVDCSEAFWVWVELAPFCLMQRTEETYWFLVAFTKETELEFMLDLSMYIARAMVKPPLFYFIVTRLVYSWIFLSGLVPAR